MGRLFMVVGNGDIGPQARVARPGLVHVVTPELAADIEGGNDEDESDGHTADEF